MLPRSNESLGHARRRARLRRRSGGAAIFIVSVTLAVLAAMGAYGLSATASDLRSSGYVRQSVQAQHASEFAMMAVAETFTPGTSAELVRQMMDNSSSSNRTTNCRSAKTSSTQTEYKMAEACLSFSEQEMANIASGTNALIPPASANCGTPSQCPFFSTTSFGGVPQRPFLRVEVTNPVNMPPPSGFDPRYVFTQLTASVYVDMRTARTAPAETIMLARGRITVGPYFQ